MATAEAEVVAAWIRRNVASGTIRYSDVMLVSWFRPRLALYAAAFERLGIPYEITGSKAFKGLTDLEAAMPLLRAIVTPEDEVAIVAFLRGPLCGVDDDALYRYRQAGGRFSPFGDVAEGTDARIANGLQIIRESIEDARKHPPAAAIARLFDRIGLIGLSASGERPGTRAGNLLQAVSIARDLSARGATLEAIIEYLGDLLEEPPDTIEELDVDPTRTDAVRLMNLHQVKGLEAPVVFLIDPSDAHEWEIDLFVDRSGEESRGHFVVMNGKKKIALPVGWDGYEQTESEFKRAERIRLLYVAATRAMRMLVVGFHTSKGAAKGAWKDLASRMRERFDRGALAAETVGPPPPAAKPYADAMTDLSARFTVARTPSYSVLPVTKVAHASHLELVKAEEGLGKGTSWGRVLHRLFEAMLRDESLNVPLYAANLIKDEERDPVELSEVLRVVEAVRGSSLWLRVKAADERYVEIPFALTVPRRDVGIDEAGDTLLHGVIDLVFREGATWYVVDYKTDSTVGRLDALTEYYAPQVRMYAEFWGRVVGGRAVGGLFFVDGCVEGWVA